MNKIINNPFLLEQLRYRTEDLIYWTDKQSQIFDYDKKEMIKLIIKQLKKEV